MHHHVHLHAGTIVGMDIIRPRVVTHAAADGVDVLAAPEAGVRLARGIPLPPLLVFVPVPVGCVVGCGAAADGGFFKASSARLMIAGT